MTGVPSQQQRRPRRRSTGDGGDADDGDLEVESTGGPPPPDGGWGWMVVLGSFLIHIVTDGVTYSFGVFYDQFLDYFNEGKAATSWIVSILVGVTLCSGPISSSFVNRWGCRPVTIAGAALASVCLIISVFAQNVATLYVTIGLGAGFGFGLIYLPAIVSVTTYFEKKRSLATGIAVCGSGFGTFVFAPISNLLIEEYGWRGAILIIAGIVLECMIFGAWFRPLEYDNVKPPTSDLTESKVLAVKSAQGKLDVHIRPVVLNGDVDNEDMKHELNRPSSCRSMGNFTLPRKFEENGNIANGKNYELKRIACSQPMLVSSLNATNLIGSESSHRRYGSHRGPLYKPDVFYQGSLLNIPSYRSRSELKSMDMYDRLLQRRPSIQSNQNIRSTPVSSQAGQSKRVKLCGIVPCSQETADTLTEMLDFSLFRDVIFLLFTMSNFLTSIGFNVPYVYIVSRARELGISKEEASHLLAIIGIANTVGRIILGYLSDKPWVNRLLVYNMCLTICGVATALSAFCLDFVTLAIYAAVFGFTIGAYVGLTSVILVDLLGLDKLTNAFGLLLLFQGIASFVGSPFAGMLYDLLGSYDPGFYMAGITMAGSGVMLFAIPPIQRYRRRQEAQQSMANGRV